MKRLEGRRLRVVVAMSGGVDSSTTAGLLVEAGHDVIGVMMKLYDHSGEDAGTQQCCGLDDVADARRVADHLQIPFYVGNYQDIFREAVVDDFVSSYLSGRTPNPCVRCNDTVKFRTLLGRARKLGADFLATGHYVRTVVDQQGQVRLLRGVDASKDQSYFVAGIPRASLERVVFPLGHLTKDQVREHATRMGLPVAAKRDSQEICFVPRNDYPAFVEAAAGHRTPGAGRIVALDGRELGRHDGIHRYTIGQRRRLGLSGKGRRYVVAVDASSDEVVVGTDADLVATHVVAGAPRWLVREPPSVQARVIARVRHRHGGAPAVVTRVEPEWVEIRLLAPVAAVTPGQQLVLYDGERVLGAATIESGPGSMRRPVLPSPPGRTGPGAWTGRSQGMPDKWGFEPTLFAALQLALGHEFEDPSLLGRALTHSSFTNEAGSEVANNERLEFLGDAVLELAVSRWLFETYPRLPEGQLTQLRARLVNSRTLAGLARNLNLGALLRLGVGEERSGGRRRRSLLADALEAVLGAVDLDAGFDSAQRVIRRLFEGRVRRLSAGAAKDPKSLLQEWSQAHHRVTPLYHVVSVDGPEHEAEFEAEVVVGDILTARGLGRSKKEAQKAAAQRALEAIGDA